MSNNSNRMPSPCIGKNCKQKAGCPRHMLMEIEVDTVLHDVRDRLVNGDVDMAEFCKMWKDMRGGTVEHVERSVQRAVNNCNPPPENIISGPFSTGCFTESC